MSERSDRSRSRENRRRDSRGRGSRRGNERSASRSRSERAPESKPGSSTDSSRTDSSRPGPILSSLQIGSPLDEFRSHFAKKQRSFEGAASPRAAEIYKRAFELAEQLIRKQRGGGD